MAQIETDPSQPIRRGRGRRPAAEVREQVLAAAGELLLTEGMAGFTIEKVAARAGASRMTIYKWWPSRGALALDGYATKVRTVLEFPDTGNIEADLTAQVLAFTRLLTETGAGKVIAELIGASQTDPELASAFRERYSAPRRALAVERMNKAIEQGQLWEDVDPQVVVDQLWGACYHRLLIPDEPITEEFAKALVHNVLIGIKR
ncbi:TetR/AcrR family transcriptional regulator [Kutzneria sp. CA-103260]|uniref:TetR/AcrR family transcriptional regulator n=1 Tax=Kutzneria sp. CA-103260 TaxID=2802641 RepID=UPI001BA623BD|nr:TetR/AcrR family transcriptional regulator [Kutzneria sp. CA-103260]QUQ65216.1 transcriptional regulator [Kutzneria sp. CA-103260]